MVTQHECDCCKQPVQSVSENGLCFACGIFHRFASIVLEETDLTDNETLDLAGELHEHVLSQLVERLQLSGQEHPLATELLQVMQPRERSN